jgi:hypothetical protein
MTGVYTLAQLRAKIKEAEENRKRYRENPGQDSPEQIKANEARLRAIEDHWTLLLIQQTPPGELLVL